MENASAHSENLASAEERRAGAPGAVGPCPNCSRLLVPAASEAADETAGRDVPSPLSFTPGLEMVVRQLSLSLLCTITSVNKKFDGEVKTSKMQYVVFSLAGRGGL